MSFYAQNTRWLGAGFTLALSSSFGQTFFISLFGAEIRTEFGLTDGEWGTLYTAATMLSAAVLIEAGKRADTIPLRHLALSIIVLYVAVALGMAFGTSWLLLILVVAGLRFCGQGMMTHLCFTAMGRWFSARRGRAIAIAALGFSLGEALLPKIAVELGAMIGWRNTWIVVAGVLAFGFAPLFAWVLSRERTPQGQGGTQVEDVAGLGLRHWTRGEVVRHGAFWMLIPGVLAPAFMGTAIFFHQAHIAEVNGWDIGQMALAYPVYAGTTIGFSLITGWAIDRIGVLRLLPIFLLPLTSGMLLLSQATSVEHWFATFALTGLSSGVMGGLMGSLWPVLYGTRHLGAVRSVASSMMVLSSALGPGITGVLIDLGVPFATQCIWMAGYCVGISALFLSLCRRLEVERLPG